MKTTELSFPHGQGEHFHNTLRNKRVIRILQSFSLPNPKSYWLPSPSIGYPCHPQLIHFSTEGKLRNNFVILFSNPFHHCSFASMKFPPSSPSSKQFLRSELPFSTPHQHSFPLKNIQFLDPIQLHYSNEKQNLLKNLENSDKNLQSTKCSPETSSNSRQSTRCPPKTYLNETIP